MVYDEEKAVKKFHRLCEIVCGIKNDSGNIPYARTYAHGGLLMGSTWGIDLQCGYILSNLDSWKGAEAHETKNEIRKLWKQNAKHLRP